MEESFDGSEQDNVSDNLNNISQYSFNDNIELNSSIEDSFEEFTVKNNHRKRFINAKILDDEIGNTIEGFNMNVSDSINFQNLDLNNLEIQDFNAIEAENNMILNNNKVQSILILKQIFNNQLNEFIYFLQNVLNEIESTIENLKIWKTRQHAEFKEDFNCTNEMTAQDDYILEVEDIINSAPQTAREADKEKVINS